MPEKLRHRSAEFPVILDRSFTDDNTAANAPIPLIFLFNAYASLRGEILERMKRERANSSLNTFVKRELVTVPWLCSFTPSIHEVSVFDNECIIVDEKLLAKDQCIISHLVLVSSAQSDTDIYEYAIVGIADAYELMCSHLTPGSWFPSALDSVCRFAPISQPDAEAEDDSTGPESDSEDDSDTELPIFVLTSCTSEQQDRLGELLSCEYTEAKFIHIASMNAEGQQSERVDQVMQYFLSRGWFPSDFVMVDETTLSSPYFTSSYKNKRRSFPSFLYGSSLTMWHAGSNSHAIAFDAVGYAVNRLQMKDEDDYGLWLGAMVKAMGLGHWVESKDAWEKHYWGCWKDKEGNVDVEVNAEPVVD
jgi:hypothetical protein